MLFCTEEICSIGEAAGKIWNYLSSTDNKPASYANLAKGTNLKKDDVLLGVGWLAKEGKINFTKEKTTVKVSLL